MTAEERRGSGRGEGITVVKGERRYSYEKRGEKESTTSGRVAEGRTGRS